MAAGGFSTNTIFPQVFMGFQYISIGYPLIRNKHMGNLWVPISICFPYVKLPVGNLSVHGFSIHGPPMTHVPIFLMGRMFGEGILPYDIYPTPEIFFHLLVHDMHVYYIPCIFCASVFGKLEVSDFDRVK